MKNLFCFLFFAVPVSCCIANQESEVAGQFNRERFVSQLNEDMDRLFKLSGSRTYDRASSCKEADALRVYFSKDPVSDARYAINMGATKYLVIGGGQLEVVAEEMPEELAKNLIKNRDFKIIDGGGDSVKCGEQLYFLRYVQWYTYAYNSILYEEIRKQSKEI